MRAHQYDARPFPFRSPLLHDILHGCEDRIRLKHHSASAAIRGIIHRMMFVVGIVPKIDGIQGNQPFCLGFAQNA
ncbi:hypothetical protein D1872_312230 [compost metagenome]